MAADVKQMFLNFIEWRKKMNVDKVVLEMREECKDVSDLKTVYHHGWHGLDKLNRPIYLERVGYFDGD